MSTPESDQERPCSDGGDLPSVYTQPNTTTEPAFLGEDYVCTELPTHIYVARTKEQQALLDLAYEGWTKDV
jgi:hypothetical protein